MNDDALRNAGLKVTTPRLKILQLLEHAKPPHLSVETIYRELKKQGDDIGLATVYRVLAQFEAVKLVLRHQFEGGYAVFELVHDKHHDHIVCERCGLVKEFVDDSIEQKQSEIAKAFGFTISNHQHTIYGVCKQCQRD